MNGELKNKILLDLARLLQEHAETIIEKNRIDVQHCDPSDPAIYDRLKVDKQKVSGMIRAVQEVIRKPDPIGKVLYCFTHDNGLQIENRVAPFGKILIIYESRPDVTIEATISAFKAGNRILLKGGKEARHTNLFLVDLWHRALNSNGVGTGWVKYLDMSRQEVQQLIRNELERIDLIIPRGGEGLIRYIRENAEVPVIVSGRGNNFLFLDQNSDAKMARDIILNGKQRISVCNALDKVLIHEGLPDRERIVRDIVKALQEMGMLVCGDEVVRAICPEVAMMEESMMEEEFLDAKILLRIVSGTEEAIRMINTYSGGHSATIVTNDAELARKFQEEVDCAAVYHNASTRFTDGGQFGFGAEIAISTQKLHFRGPIGLGQLVSNKWFISGSGQVRT